LSEERGETQRKTNDRVLPGDRESLYNIPIALGKKKLGARGKRPKKGTHKKKRRKKRMGKNRIERTTAPLG